MRGDPFQTVLSGSMFRLIPWLADAVMRRLAEVAPRSSVSPLLAEPACGAVHLALAMARGTVRVPPYIQSPATPTA